MPCIKHVPEVVAAHERFSKQGFRVLAVSIDESGKEKKLRELTAKHHMTWPQIYDGEGGGGPLPTKNDVKGIPATFLLDRSGRVRYTNLGGPQLERRIAELLAQGK